MVWWCSGQRRVSEWAVCYFSSLKQSMCLLLRYCEFFYLNVLHNPAVSSLLQSICCQPKLSVVLNVCIKTVISPVLVIQTSQNWLLYSFSIAWDPLIVSQVNYYWVADCVHRARAFSNQIAKHEAVKQERKWGRQVDRKASVWLPACESFQLADKTASHSASCKWTPHKLELSRTCDRKESHYMLINHYVKGVRDCVYHALHDQCRLVVSNKWVHSKRGVFKIAHC